MSRARAKKSVRGEQLREELRSRGIVVRAGSMSGLAEETPAAYKDVARVVDVVESAGIGRKLVEAIIEHARQQVELLQLFVIADNMPARGLYTSLGFVEYGIERHATKYHGQYHDDVMMALPLMPDTAAEASCAPAREIPAEEVSA